MAQERTESVQVRLTPEEKEAFAASAERDGISLSDWLRRTARAAAIKEAAALGEKPAFLKPRKRP